MPKVKMNKLSGRVYVIRHAESTFNAAWSGTLQGYNGHDPMWETEFIDAPLSPKGETQCINSRDCLPNLKVIIVSPMMRAV